jgi:DNA-directed RNA polymerase specialized sigma24 family protein
MPKSALLDPDDFHTIVHLREHEIQVLRAMYPSQAHLISVTGIDGSYVERIHVSQLLWQASKVGGTTKQLFQWLWDLRHSPYAAWDFGTRLTIPLLMLDEVIIHRQHLVPRTDGSLDIAHGVYPSPTLFDHFRDPDDVASWTRRNFYLRPSLRIVEAISVEVFPRTGETVSANLTDTGAKTSIDIPLPLSVVPSHGLDHPSVHHHFRPHDHRSVTPDEGNPATIALYQDIYEVVLGIVASEPEAKALADATLKWYFHKHPRTLILEAARPVVLAHARRAALASLTDLELVNVLVDQFTIPRPERFADADADWVDRRFTVIQSLKLLTSEESGALLLRYCYDLPFDKLAFLMNCDVPAIRALLTRAMASFITNLSVAE